MVSVAELKAKLSSFLARVRDGEDVVVTDRGKPVARLVPFQARTSEQAEVLQRLAREGVVRLPLTEPVEPRMPLARSRKSVLEALLEERRESDR